MSTFAIGLHKTLLAAKACLPADEWLRRKRGITPNRWIWMC